MSAYKANCKTYSVFVSVMVNVNTKVFIHIYLQQTRIFMYVNEQIMYVIRVRQSFFCGV